MSLINQARAAKIGDEVGIFIEGDGTIDWAGYAKTAVGMIFIFTAIAVFIYLIWGAIGMITANGDQAKMDLGRKRITWAIIGLVVVAGGFVIWQLGMSVAGLNAVDTGGL